MHQAVPTCTECSQLTGPDDRAQGQREERIAVRLVALPQPHTPGGGSHLLTLLHSGWRVMRFSQRNSSIRDCLTSW